MLAGYAVWVAAEQLRAPRARLGALVVLVVALCAQGLVSSVHLDRVLGREDTRAQAKRWLEDNVPARAGVAIEPFVPADYLRRGPAAELRVAALPGQAAVPGLREEAAPGARGALRPRGVLLGRGRQLSEGAWPEGGAARRARLLRARSTPPASSTETMSPYRKGAKPVPFSYDKSFNYQPRAYERPGPLIEIHHLRGCS